MRRAWYWRWKLRGTEPSACFGCGGPLGPQRLPVVIARAGGLEAQARDLPYRSCGGDCGDRRTALPGFAAAVLAAVMQGAVPVARGSRSGEWQCRRCSSRLWSPVRRLASVEGEVALEGIPAFTLTITGPTSACGSCGAVQLRATPGVARELRTILEETWRAAGLRSGFR